MRKKIVLRNIHLVFHPIIFVGYVSLSQFIILMHKNDILFIFFINGRVSAT